MIKIKEAVSIAQEYYLKEGVPDILEVYDSKDCWIIFGGKKNVPLIGSAGISVNKETGTISDFILPSRENFKLLSEATKMTIDKS